MSKTDGLGNLKMGESWHHGLLVSACLIKQGLLQLPQQFELLIDFAAQPETNVSCDLIVSGSGGVQSFTGVANELCKPSLDIQMDIFQINRPDKRTMIDFGSYSRHALNNRVEIGVRDDATFAQHLSVGERGFDIGIGKALVKPHRSGVTFNDFAHRLVKARRPSLLFSVK
jgi:hypothetical protein